MDFGVVGISCYVYRYRFFLLVSMLLKFLEDFDVMFWDETLRI